MIKIDNPTWYYLQEANNGLFELLQFLNSDDVSTDELEKLSINEEQKDFCKRYYWLWRSACSNCIRNYCT